MSTSDRSQRAISRRATLRLMGAAGAAAVAGWKGDWSGLWRAGGGSTASADTFDCVAKPELTEGPYFVDERLNRSDIRSDPMTGVVKSGVPLVLTFKLHRLESGSCTPLAGAYVDVWHTDASGKYSDEAANDTVGQKYLRGYQVSDENGEAQFTTIFPGWYQGRTIHIHFKIRTFSGDSKTYDFTSQLFFGDTTTAEVLSRAPYSSRGTPDTSNSRDGIYGQSGGRLTLDLVESGNGYAATFDVGLEGVPQTSGGGDDGGSTTPAIAAALVKHGKLVVTGSGFGSGAAILVGGAALATRNNAANPTTVLVAKGGARQIDRGQTVALQVRNADGTLSNEFAYTRPAA
jgi:protocatechuate 3,4-dioxygenase beta subunit